MHIYVEIALRVHGLIDQSRAINGETIGVSREVKVSRDEVAHVHTVEAAPASGLVQVEFVVEVPLHSCGANSVDPVEAVLGHTERHSAIVVASLLVGRDALPGVHTASAIGADEHVVGGRKVVARASSDSNAVVPNVAVTSRDVPSRDNIGVSDASFQPDIVHLYV